MTPMNCIMFIDDSPTDLYVSKRISEINGLCRENITANNGLVALTTLEHYYRNNKTLPELIFVDMQISPIGGLEIIKRIKASWYFDEKNTELIVLTAGVDTEAQRRDIESLGIRYMTKPLDIVQLKEILARRSFIGKA